jgi:hypothetical protein
VLTVRDKAIRDTNPSMTNLDSSPLNQAPGWHKLVEFLIFQVPGSKALLLEQVEQMLKQLGLEADQVSRIQSTIDQTLNSLDNLAAPVHIRISVSGTERSNAARTILGQAQDLRTSHSELGYFLVKRFVQPLNDSSSQAYRMLEVIIYRE